MKIPGIWDFSQSRDFYPQDSGFFLISVFLSQGFWQNHRDSGFFRNFSPSGYPGDFLSPRSEFFLWLGYYYKRPTLLSITFGKKNYSKSRFFLKTLMYRLKLISFCKKLKHMSSLVDFTRILYFEVLEVRSPQIFRYFTQSNNVPLKEY